MRIVVLLYLFLLSSPLFLRSYKVIRNRNIVINSTIIGASAAETNQINYYGGQAVKLKVSADDVLSSLFGQ